MCFFFHFRHLQPFPVFLASHFLNFWFSVSTVPIKYSVLFFGDCPSLDGRDCFSRDDIFEKLIIFIRNADRLWEGGDSCIFSAIRVAS